MSGGRIRVSVGTRFVHDGDIYEIIEIAAGTHGMDVVAACGASVRRMTLTELLSDARVRLLCAASDAARDHEDDERETAALTLARLNEAELRELHQRVEHVQEVLTGYRSGNRELARPDEPRPGLDPSLPLEARYSTKATEIGKTARTVKRWVADFQRYGPAGLASRRLTVKTFTDERWVQEALEVMASYTNLSRPTRKAVIRKINHSCIERYGDGVINAPSRPTAYRVLSMLEKRHPLFRLSTQRNRDIAGRPSQPYGKLHATRPGEYVYMDTTRLDVHALDPITLQWVNVELTVAMDAVTRCILGLRLRPTTKAVDGVSVLLQCYRPHPAAAHWPDHAVWPEHGIPRYLLIDRDAYERQAPKASGPAIVPETIVVDHGKIYVSDHMISVCNRLGISIQPARIREPRDKAPVERFFLTIREGLLQHLDGYKGPDLYSRGLNVESRAFYYVDELEAIIREWVAAVYHLRPHDGLVEPGLPSARFSPAAMYEHSLSRSGFVEVPADPNLAFEFFEVRKRTITHSGVKIKNRLYSGPILNDLAGQRSPYTGRFRNGWPVYIDPEDIRFVYMCHPTEHTWHALQWEHAAKLAAPFSADALEFARGFAARRHRFVDDELALDELLDRWEVESKSSVAERRIALDLAREGGQLSQEIAPRAAVARMASVGQWAHPEEQPAPEAGDDDSDDDYDDRDGPDNDYYANTLEDA